MRNPLSKMVAEMEPSGIRRFFDVASTMDNVISLGVGEPDFDTPWHIREEGIYSLEKGRTFYTSNAGLLPLRKEVCTYLKRRFALSYDSDEVIITVNPQLLAMMGLQDFLRTVGKIKKRINPRLEIAGILLTMCESRTTLCKVLTEEVTESFQGKIKVFQTRIPATVKVGESIDYNMPIAQYSKKASAGIAYRKFAKEIIAYEG